MRHLAQDVIQLLETQRQQPKRVVPETPAAPATVPTPAALPLPAAADPRSATPRRWLEYASGARSWARSRLGGAS
jgi:hypothetical protein